VAGPGAAALAAACGADVVLNGITGSIGLPDRGPGADAGAANKESLIIGGDS
jgi:1-deoxy-D-xylulose-5-phosphate reductoisomerase